MGDLDRPVPRASAALAAVTIRPFAANDTALLYGFRTSAEDGSPMWVALFALGVVVLNAQSTPAANEA